jgi:hypothetical protein
VKIIFLFMLVIFQEWTLGELVNHEYSVINKEKLTYPIEKSIDKPIIAIEKINLDKNEFISSYQDNIPIGIYRNVGFVIRYVDYYSVIFLSENAENWMWFEVPFTISDSEKMYKFRVEGEWYYIVQYGDFIDFLPVDYENKQGIGIYKSEYYPGEGEQSILSEVSSSSYLTETISGKRIEYNPSNLQKNVFSAFPGFLYLNTSSIPWVEGVENDGVHEILNLSFNTKQSEILILNGYFDPKRLDLYFKNNRMKEVLITFPDGTNMKYLFRDKLGFQLVQFPHSVSRINIEILSVYYGSRYNDTAVTGIVDVNKVLFADEMTQWTSLLKENNKVEVEFIEYNP